MPASTTTSASAVRRGNHRDHGDPWDIVVYEARKAIRCCKGQPQCARVLWLERRLYIDLTPPGGALIGPATSSPPLDLHPFMGYARAQLLKMERGAFKGYMGEKRKQLVGQYGYDTKNAAHLIPVAAHGHRVSFRDGEYERLCVHDAALNLLAIKHGEWTLERVKLEAERLFRRAEDAHAASTLPDEPDPDAINALTVAVIGEALGLR